MNPDQSPIQQLRNGVDRIDGSPIYRSTRELRPEQARVVADLWDFMRETVHHGAADASRCGRIILPPRTGKTVIAGASIGQTGLHTTFIVPTKVLVQQAACEFAEQLPGVPVGVYYGERKQLVPRGINVTTYAILQRILANEPLPEPIRNSELVFFDEAHHTLTPGRMHLVRDGFSSLALRVALTATPDWDHTRTLCRLFPSLIHELTLEDALELNLLAPARMWVYEVDADASEVQLVAGDYDLGALGRLMSQMPFARTLEQIRYLDTNRDKPALVTCVSRQQAYDLQAYLSLRQAPGRPAPGLILGETKAADRQRILADFAAGRIDTLIQVGVLLEGWSSARCKLLIDLAPSVSLVRCTQKYFRVMTRAGDTEAHIFILLPADLRVMPILPTELFGESLREYECGALFGPPRDAAGMASESVEMTPIDAIREIRACKRILVSGRVAKPKLQRDDLAAQRAVIRSCPHFDETAPCGLYRFRGLWFAHPLFTGYGEALLRWLGVGPRRRSYLSLLARLFPDGASHYYLASSRTQWSEPGSCRADAAHLIQAIHNPQDAGNPGVAVGYRALAGVAHDVVPTPAELVAHSQQREQLSYLLSALSRRQRRVIVWTFGLLGQPELKGREIADIEDVSRERVRQIQQLALKKLRRYCSRNDDGSLSMTTGMAARHRLPPFRIGLPVPSLWYNLRTVDPAAWLPLSNPIPVHDLPGFLDSVLVRLRVKRDILRYRRDHYSYSPWNALHSHSAEIGWQQDGQRLFAQVYDRFSFTDQGRHVVAGCVDFVLEGLLGSANLYMAGIGGEFDFYAVTGQHAERIHDAVEDRALRRRRRRRTGSR